MSKRSTEELPEIKDIKKAKTVPHVTADDNDDVTEQARYFVTSAQGIQGSVKLIGWDASEAPSSEEDINKMAASNDLRHGDVITFGASRDNSTYYIAHIDPDTGKIRLVENPDESSSGYLTIPREILKHVQNFQKQYSDIIKHAPAINFHPSSSDEYLCARLGTLPDEGWAFDIGFALGELESFSVRPQDGDTEYETFDLENVTWKDVTDFFEARSEPQADVKVKVTLEGEELQKYKDKCSQVSGQHSDWMRKQPDLPIGWRCERGAASGGANKQQWLWKLKGPATTEDQVRDNIDTLLKDFTYKYED